MVQSGVPSGATSRLPTRNLATSSMGLCVADSPILVTGPSASSHSRSTERLRWEPRLFPATACSSSRMRVRTFLSDFRPLSEVRRMYRDSGVVISMWGGRLTIACRSLCDVSPVLTDVLISGSGWPACWASSAIPARGSERFFLMSLERALRGDT